MDLTQMKSYRLQKSSDIWQLNLGASALFADFINTTSSGKQSEKFEQAPFVCSKYGILGSNKNGDDSVLGFL